MDQIEVIDDRIEVRHAGGVACAEIGREGMLRKMRVRDLREIVIAPEGGQHLDGVAGRVADAGVGAEGEVVDLLGHTLRHAKAQHPPSQAGLERASSCHHRNAERSEPQGSAPARGRRGRVRPHRQRVARADEPGQCRQRLPDHGERVPVTIVASCVEQRGEVLGLRGGPGARRKNPERAEEERAEVPTVHRGPSQVPRGARCPAHPRYQMRLEGGRGSGARCLDAVSPR